MDIFDEIEKFKYRYIILNTNQYNIVSGKYRDKIKRENVPYNAKYVLLDWEIGEVVLYSDREMKSKTFHILNHKKSEILSFLNEYKTDDKSMLVQCDKVKPRIDIMGDIYAIGNIWLAYTYRTKSKKLRMCINTNIFGEFKLIGSRNMILNELLLSL